MAGKFLPLMLALVCVTLSAAAQLAMKVGMAPPEGSNVGSTYLHALTSPWVWVGLGCYGLSAVAWLWVLSKLDVSLAYPLVSLGFVLTMAAGVWWLGEAWSWQRAGGALLIVAGVLLMAADA